MKIRINDRVKILTGKDRGKEGTVKKVIKDDALIVVEGVNVVKKHVKPGAVSKEGGIISMEKPISVANVMAICSKCKRPVRVGFSISDGKKKRVCRRCGEALDK